MTADDAATFAQAMTSLGLAFGEELEEARLEVYFAALGDLPLEAVLTAVTRATRERTFFPRPAELRALAGDLAPTVGLVESLLVAHLRETGGERRHPDDPFLCLVVDRLGGLRSVAGMDSVHRIELLAKLLPGLVEACRVRGLPMPNESTTALPALVQRSIARGAPVPQITGEGPVSGGSRGLAQLGEVLPKVTGGKA